MRTLSAWDSPAHAQEYDYLAAAPRWLRKRFYERFNEIKALPEHVSSIIEVGCATGELARYLLDRYPGVRYTGFDVSLASIQRAREKCPAQFICGHFQDYDLHAELVICRDVVHHQPDPWKFLTDLYAITEQMLIVRLRTGPRTYQSSQRLYGHTVPYWIVSKADLRRWGTKHGGTMQWLDMPERALPLWLRTARWFYRRA